MRKGTMLQIPSRLHYSVERFVSYNEWFHFLISRTGQIDGKLMLRKIMRLSMEWKDIYKESKEGGDEVVISGWGYIFDVMGCLELCWS
jgi:hypothetical protein